MKFTSHALAIALLLIASPAFAQFFYSPPPPLMGQASYHLYSVPGVTNSGGVETFFACTNTTDTTIRVGIEVFNPPGGVVSDPSATSLDILPGGTNLFATGAAAWISVDSLVAVGALSKGSARILATEKKGIICTAYLADDSNAPPTSMVDLKVIAKAKQRGE